MPMFGSTSGGKAGTSGASDQTCEGTPKAARPKEGTDQGAVSSDPQNDATSRESSPIEARQVYKIPEIVLPYFLVYK